MTVGSLGRRSTRMTLLEKESDVNIDHFRIDNKLQLKEKFEMGIKLGKGSFGTVRLVHNLETRETFACKIIRKPLRSPVHMEQVNREIDILKRVRHRHIVCLHQVYETSVKVYLIMEYCNGGELIHRLPSPTQITEDEIRTIISRLTDAIAYLHDNGIVHRDIKPENVLLSARDPSDPWDIKLSDFGLAGITGSGNETLMENVCGTPLYMAPEIITKQGYSQQCDIWSIGILMYLLLRNYTREAEMELKEGVSRVKFTLDLSTWDDVSHSARNLLEKMLQVDPALRITAKEILLHPWITKSERFCDSMGHQTVLEMMKQYSAEQRWKKIVNVIIATHRFSRLGIIIDDEGEFSKSVSNLNSSSTSESDIIPCSSSSSTSSSGKYSLNSQSTRKRLSNEKLQQSNSSSSQTSVASDEKISSRVSSRKFTWNHVNPPALSFGTTRRKMSTTTNGAVGTGVTGSKSLNTKGVSISDDNVCAWKSVPAGTKDGTTKQRRKTVNGNENNFSGAAGCEEIRDSTKVANVGVFGFGAHQPRYGSLSRDTGRRPHI